MKKIIALATTIYLSTIAIEFGFSFVMFLIGVKLYRKLLDAEQRELARCEYNLQLSQIRHAEVERMINIRKENEKKARFSEFMAEEVVKLNKKVKFGNEI